MEGKIVWETERLIIRELVSDDLGNFHKIQSDPHVMQYAGGNDSLEENRRQLDFCISCYQFENNEWRFWSIFRKQSNEFIGTYLVF